MKQLLFLMAIVTLWSITGAVAQDRVPSGCFVTDEERVRYSGSYSCSNCAAPACFNEARQVIIPWNPGNGYTQEELRQLYGFQYGSEIVSSYSHFERWQQCDAAYNNVNANYNTLGTAYNRQVALVRRLRAACGSKCRRIK